MQPHPILLDIARSQKPRAVVDPDALIASAIDHRMTGLLWDEVDAGRVALPAGHANDLARRDLWTRGHHRKLWATAELIRSRLESVGAQGAIFKGVAAEQRWYGRQGARPCTDLDVLLRPEDLRRCHEVLAALQPDNRVTPSAIKLFRTGMLQSIDLVIDGIEVDFHGDLLKLDVPARQNALFWKRTQEIPGSQGLRTIDAETSLVQFVLHLNKDRFARLVGYVDVARVLSDDLDWAAIAAMFDAEGLREVGRCTLDRVVETLALPVHPLAAPTGWRSRMWHQLWPPEHTLEGGAGLLRLQHRLLWLPWLARGRPPEALRWWLRRRVLPPSDLVDYQHPYTRGPYLWRLVTGRLRRFRERRAEARAAS
ncbi:MAG TPA: nucleotidyltransferase family protein [Egibacteraceae bacterium]|nr:nucleotidyltransferase family protein [Egibacteraceae bacterium]